MSMLADAILGHSEGVKAIAERARAQGAAQAASAALRDMERGSREEQIEAARARLAQAQAARRGAEKARRTAEDAGRYLEVIAVVVGTDEDPQGLNAQIQQLEAAGAQVETSNDAAVHYAGRLLRALVGAAAGVARREEAEQDEHGDAAE